MNLFSVSSCGIKTISDWDPRRWHNKSVLALGIGQAVLQSNGLKDKPNCNTDTTRKHTVDIPT